MFYEVLAKCGHVGRNKYIVKKFYVKADTAKEAARQIRNAPRVKHHHKDAIIQVCKITHEEYVEGVIKHQEDEYFNVRNSSDQKRIAMDEIRYEPSVELIRTRNVLYKLRKWKILEFESKKMIAGAYYG